ncbi:MAG TPA: OmpA family protein [Spirochaetota bacterium]|nr:OmpA family protein [Spirochaetota bacterium]HQO40647.1 OmpA family protein [Spirochaetota bacterium]
MKKYLQLIIGSVILAFFVSACGGGEQVKTEQTTDDTQVQVQSGAGADDMAIKAINNEIDEFFIDGFSGDSSKIRDKEDMEKMKKIVRLVKPIVNRVPDGYVMQITGHTADYESTARQKKVSEARAKAVYNALINEGVSAKKLVYRGVGSDEPRPGYDKKDFAQRCVSFKAVKK